MSEEAIKQTMRNLKTKTAELLNCESFYPNEAAGKGVPIYDLLCFDKMGFKIIKVCLDTIQKNDLHKLLSFHETPFDNGTIIQIFFWHLYGHKPFYRPKLFYGQPKQQIPEELQKLVK